VTFPSVSSSSRSISNSFDRWFLWVHIGIFDRDQSTRCSPTSRFPADMGMKEEVKPNFRTPPRWGKLVAYWHARTTYWSLVDGAQKISWWRVVDVGANCPCAWWITSPLGTPRGRYDEYSS
jgi:hypothetical protein